MRRLFRGIWEIVREAQADNIMGESARIAYFFFLSMWPLLLALFAFTGIFGGEPAFEWIMGWIRATLPIEGTRFLETYVLAITAEERPEMLSLGILLTLWSGSNIFAVMIQGLNKMYNIGEARPWWKRRGLAVVLLVCAGVLLTSGAAAILAGGEIAARLGIERAIALLRYPLAFGALTVLLYLVYYYLPARDQDLARRHVLVGALVGSSLWLLVTSIFRLYVANFGNYETYGVVGAVIVLLLWLYLTAASILFGGEVAVSLEQGVHRRHLEREARRAVEEPSP